MPFKLRLKKSRQYNVVSKSLFVICVELLDGTSIECTLSAESVGRECLDNVCQRLGLHQPEFFGLRYLSHQSQPRWVEMNQPLKKQLDKHAREPNLYLRVMFYVSGVVLLHDEMTRYHYFLQLKLDVIEGRIGCNHKQAVLLASYSMQAEFGNHDLERHTAEYLKDFALFPKHLTKEGQLENLTEAVICQHAALGGLSQGTAEEYYILAAQQLDGYGQETFMAKDDTGVEVIIGISLNGIIITYESIQTSKFFRWNDIANVVNHKRGFSIEGQPPYETLNFQFPEPESARYIWSMCINQHRFYMQHKQELEDPGRQNLHSEEQGCTTLFQGGSEDCQLLDSRDELDMSVPGGGMEWDMAIQRAQSTSCLDLSKNSSDLDMLRSLLPSYRPAPDYETAIQQKFPNAGQANNNISIRPNHQIGGILYSSQPEIHQANAIQENLNSYRNFKHYPDVAQVDRLYEEPQRIMKSRRDHNSPQQTVLPALHTYSKHRAVWQTAGSTGATTLCQHVGADNNTMMTCRLVTPELDTLENNLVQGLQLLHLYKPPPPYPINRPSSNSTPDLASQTLAPPHPCFVNMQVSGSSPDLVSSRNVGRHHSPLQDDLDQQPHFLESAVVSLHQHSPQHHLLPNSEVHHTYTNIAAMLDQRAVYHDIEAILEEREHQHGTTVPYCSPEPIYENVPLPWAIDGRQAFPPSSAEDISIRSRTSSIQSAPEMSRASMEHKLPGNNVQGPLGTNNNLVHQQYYHMQSANNIHVQLNHAPSKAHELASFSLPFPSKNKLVSSTADTIYSPDHSLSQGKLSPGSSGSQDSTKQKRRRWALLVGGKSGKSSTTTRRSKSKDRTPEEEAASNAQHRWSTGLPRVPLPPSISKETMCQLLEKKLVDSQLFFEFEKIPKKKSNVEFTTALHPDNVSRNRYKDVLPYEENRVRLTPNKENRLGYFNASHITATVGNQQRFYIAAQSPLPNTIISFWQMVWEADVYLLVMLNGNKEEGATPYCPQLGDRGLEVGEYQVWHQFSQETGHCITTKLRLYHAPSRRARGVWHLQYPEWGDQGCPSSVGHFLGFLEELSSVRQHTVSEIPAGHNRNPPVLVHCSAGVGRTGVTILSDLLLYTLDHNQELDVPRVVALLRHQRMLMVQTVAQYRFVYSLLIYYLKHSRLI
uniref:protein-tyrosine-phosphatase n=1 Tax=Timema tahoe TaxID=61484 RepID=A0A7R9IIX0_9NEOP|nr:unnamed protein product [Timema tahoe]